MPFGKVDMESNYGNTYVYMTTKKQILRVQLLKDSCVINESGGYREGVSTKSCCVTEFDASKLLGLILELTDVCVQVWTVPSADLLYPEYLLTFQ
jgi:hypothetical protein